VKRNGERVGLFGGAFDPVHIGHLKVVESFLKSRLIDRVLLLPTAHPPHKNVSSSASFSHRLEMLALAFESYDRVEVSDLENRLPEPSYTLQTITHLQQQNSETDYFLCIGEDNLAAFHKWHHYGDILQRVPLVVAGRPDVEAPQKNQEILNRTIMIEHDEVEISSTTIRNAGKSGNLHKYVPENVIDYIQRHNLYSDTDNS